MIHISNALVTDKKFIDFNNSNVEVIICISEPIVTRPFIQDELEKARKFSLWERIFVKITKLFDMHDVVSSNINVSH